MMIFNRYLKLSAISLSNKWKSSKYLYSTLTSRDILDARVSDSGTLYNSFAKYIALENCKKQTGQDLIKTKINYADYYPIQNIHNFSDILQKTHFDQLARLIIYTSTYKTNGDPDKIAKAINEIDTFCVANINKMNLNTILDILHCFLYLIPNNITRLDFYKRSISRLVEEFNGEENEKNEFVQIGYYIGLWKKNSQNAKLMDIFLRKHFESFMEQLSTFDFIIVSNAAFKTSTTFSGDIFRKRLVLETMNCSPQNDAVLVTLVKALRLNKVKVTELYEKLSKHFLNSDFDHLHFKGLSHLFVYFADGHWNAPDVCRHIVQKGINILKNVSFFERRRMFNDIRAKDLAAFTWCCAYLKIDFIKPDDLSVIESIILDDINNGAYKKYENELNDTVLSLWMLGYKSKKLIDAVIGHNSMLPVKSDQIKLESRRKLLMQCVKIEKPEWIQHKNGNKRNAIEISKAPYFLIEKFKSLNNIFNTIQKNKDTLSIDTVEFVTVIKELNIPSILIKYADKNTCLIECIDRSQQLRFLNEPNAIVSLKLNLLKVLGYNYIVINPEGKSSEQIVDEIKEKTSCATKEFAQNIS